MSALKPVVTTTLSTKGQLILPKAVRDSRGWKAGDRISVEETPDGLILKREREPVFPPTRMEDVYGMFRHKAVRPTSLEDMKLAAAEGAAERYRRSFETDADDDDA